MASAMAYIGSFALFVWTKPRWVCTGEIGRPAGWYCALYHPLRILTASSRPYIGFGERGSFTAEFIGFRDGPSHVRFRYRGGEYDAAGPGDAITRAGIVNGDSIICTYWSGIATAQDFTSWRTFYLTGCERVPRKVETQ
jgi:hypothetical protein